MINGKLPSTPKALFIFERAGSFVVSRCTMADMGLSKGALCSEKSLLVLKEKMPALFEQQYTDVRTVLEIWKNTRFNHNTDKHPSWALHSAERFIASCVATCAAVEIKA